MDLLIFFKVLVTSINYYYSYICSVMRTIPTKETIISNKHYTIMKHLKLFLTSIFIYLGGVINVFAADLAIDEYLSTFNGQYSYNVLLTTPESDWHWTTATTPINSSSASYPSWGGSSSLYPFAVTSKESVTEGSVRITLDCSFKRYSNSYTKCRVEVYVGDKLLYCQYAEDNHYYYNYADIKTTDYNQVDQELTFVSFGKVSGEVSVRVNRTSVSGALNGTFSLRSIKVERANLVPPTVVSDQPNPAEAAYTLTVTNNDPDAALYWKATITILTNMETLQQLLKAVSLRLIPMTTRIASMHLPFAMASTASSSAALIKSR